MPWEPIQRKESKRLDLQHHVFNLTLEGQLHLAPLGTVHNVLDMGTGTGNWAIDFAKLHPEAQVIGSDSSGFERPQSYVRDDLTNLSFVLADAEEEWTFGTKFDYIHGRLLQISFNDVKGVFGRAFDSLAPGRWLEMQDILTWAMSDTGAIDGTALNNWYIRQRKAGEARGRPFSEPPKYE